MITFHELTLRNFLSYGNNTTTFTFDSHGAILIAGENLDDTSNGVGANGCGKSAIINALVFALFDKTISDINKDKLINNINGKDMQVSVTFEKDNIFYKIVRARKTDAGNYIKVYQKNSLDFTDSDEITRDSIVNNNLFIEKVLGITYELFTRIVIFSANHVPFLDLPARATSGASQTGIIEELFGLTTLSEKAEILKDQIKDKETQFETKKLLIKQLEVEHTRYEEQLKSATKRVLSWDAQQDSLIAEQQNNLNTAKSKTDFSSYKENLQKSLIRNEMSLLNIEEEIVALKAELETENLSFQTEKQLFSLEKQQYDIAEADLTLKDKERELAERSLDEPLTAAIKKISNLNSLKEKIETTIKNNKNTITLKQKELSHLEEAKCPYCLQQYKDVEAKIAECKDDITKGEQTINDQLSQLELIQEEIPVWTDKQTSIKQQIEVLRDESKQRMVQRKELSAQLNVKLVAVNCKQEVLNTKQNGINKKQAQLDLVKKDIIKLQTDINNVDKQILTHASMVESLETKLLELKATVNPYIEPLDELQSNKLPDVDYTEINSLEKYIEHQKFLMKLLTKKDSFVRKALLNKNIPFLNSRLQKYLSDIGLPHKVEFTHDLTANISQFGRSLDFGNLSGGQRSRVNIGLAWAFRDVLQSLHTKINIMILDEILDVGLDNMGITATVRALKRKSWDESVLILIISHREEIVNIFENKMIIQLQGGFSNLKVA